jgi:hypothetical protein
MAGVAGGAQSSLDVAASLVGKEGLQCGGGRYLAGTEVPCCAKTFGGPFRTNYGITYCRLFQARTVRCDPASLGQRMIVSRAVVSLDMATRSLH